MTKDTAGARRPLALEYGSQAAPAPCCRGMAGAPQQPHGFTTGDALEHHSYLNQSQSYRERTHEGMAV
eukprot:365272-Chlamydomonas_euryale.AAC.16